MTNLKNFFAESSEIVNKRLDELIPSETTEPTKLFSAIRWSVFAGGKLFRPTLCLAVGKTFNQPVEKFLNTAAAVEMIHAYSLIHDDLPAMDDDKLRRGRATCHIKFDEATAILAADILQTYAFQSINSDKNLNDEIKVKLIAELAEAAGKMVIGQMLDMQSEGKKLSGKELENIHRNKTGAMIRVSARSAALIANVSENELSAITEYAENLGLLFQVTDDLLDITQTTEVLGKTAGKDLLAEKSTYPNIYGLEKTKQMANEIYQKAVDSLSVISGEKQILVSLADYILHREK